jgi:hypothetical protein
MECYRTLTAVAKEFSELEKQLKDAPENTKEHDKVLNDANIHTNTVTCNLHNFVTG